MNRYIYPQFKRPKTPMPFAIGDRVAYISKGEDAMHGVIVELNDNNNNVRVKFDKYPNADHRMLIEEIKHE